MKQNAKKLKFDLFWLLPLLICIAGLPGKYITSGDESRVAGIIQEMLIYHNWGIPKLNGTAFLEYPPLFYWLQAIPLAMFKTEWSLAIIPCLISFCSGIITYLLALKLRYSENTAKTSVIFLLCGSQFFFNRLECRVDITLAFFCLCSVFNYVCMRQAGNQQQKFVWLIFTVLSISAGIFTKGLLGAVLPISVMGGSVFISDLLNRKLSIKKYFVIFAISILSLLPLAAWLLHIYSQLGQDGFYTAFIHNNISRFSGNQGDHSRVIFWYFIKIPEIFLPFIPLLLFDLYFALRKIFSKKDENSIVILSYLLFPWLIFNVASAKRLVYLLPLAPAAAILAADGAKNMLEIMSKKITGSYNHLCRNTKKYIIAGLTIVAALLISEHIVRIFQYKDNCLKNAFAYAAKLETGKKQKIVLINASERTHGAAVFYLRRRVVNKKITSKSNTKPAEIWICRIKPQCGAMFADRHQVLDSAEQQKLFLKIMQQPQKTK